MSTRHPLVVSVYTKGSPYEAEAQELAQSAAAFGYPVRLIAVPDQGDWWRNVGIKPRMVLETLKGCDGPLLALDADCRILQPLDDMLRLLDDADLTVKYRPGSCFSALFNAAVLLLRRTPGTLSLVEAWAEIGGSHARRHRFAEQGAFAEAVLRNQHQVRVRPLPEPFHMFASAAAPDTPPAGCVIFHRKSSRAVRNTALPPQMPETTPRADNAEYVTLKRKENAPTGGYPMGGAAGADEDFKEYASRYGINRVWSLSVAVPTDSAGALEAIKPSLWRNLDRQFPVGSRLVVCDSDLVLLRDPRVFAVNLDVADLVLSWDLADSKSEPSTAIIGMKLSPSMSALLERLECSLQQEPQTNDGTRSLLAGRLASQLRAGVPGLQVMTLPGHVIGDLSASNSELIAVANRGAMRIHTGGAKCPPLSPHVPLWTATPVA